MKFEKQTFTTDVTLDFNEFVDCVFTGCTVYFHGNPYLLIRTDMEGISLKFAGAAAETLSTLKALRQRSPQLVEDLINKARDTAAPAGTLTN